LKRLVVTEHTRIERRTGSGPGGGPGVAFLEERHYDRVRNFDCLAREERDRVFEWSDGFARTAQWVGVVQVPGVQIEILPKVDALAEQGTAGEEQVQYEARRNLLYMLSLSGDVPVRSRDVARLAVRQAPLSETLSAIFADRLRQELLLGPERAYQELQDNLRCFKGKLQVSRQALHNAAHRERFFCRYDEFSEDTLMNRIFRASCRALLEVTRTPATQDVLRHCLLLLDGVVDVEVQESEFGRISLNRQSERFEDVLRFCRLLLSGRTPTIQAGGTKTFSLLFDMNKVFERFVAAFLRRHVVPRLPGVQVFPQAAHHKLHLMESEGAGVLRLEPDLLVESADKRLVMDTKWKLLAPGKRGRGGVADADLYQLYAYTRRYGCTRSVLLYPFVPGLEAREFGVLDANGGPSGERVSIRHVRLHRNLQQEAEREALAQELAAILRDGLDWKSAALVSAGVGGAA
jgi:5-methylcytosine-specific restriction enzyme subunit McrC